MAAPKTTQTIESDYRYRHRSSVGMTVAMWTKLEQVVQNRKDPKFTASDAVREAVRFYLDQQDDLIGSRKHFSRSLERNLNEAEDRITFILYTIVFIVARTGSVIIKQLTKQDIPVQALIESALVDAHKYSAQLNQLADKVSSASQGNVRQELETRTQK